MRYRIPARSDIHTIKFQEKIFMKHHKKSLALPVTIVIFVTLMTTGYIVTASNDKSYAGDEKAAAGSTGWANEEAALNPEMVLIPANKTFSFLAAIPNDIEDQVLESPINDEYYMGKYQVTVAEYSTFCKATGHAAPSYWTNKAFDITKKGYHPVVFVSYSDALNYCKWLNEKSKSGMIYRLPTEAEWENAARGNTQNVWPWGIDDPVYDAETDSLSTKVIYNGSSALLILKEYGADHKVTFTDKSLGEATLGSFLKFNKSNRGSYSLSGWSGHGGGMGLNTCSLYRDIIKASGGYTVPVDSYPEGQSPYGLYNMAGNAWEWTSSVVKSGTFPEKNFKGAAAYGYTVRGGSWYANLGSARNSYRGDVKSGAQSSHGFRLAAQKKDMAVYFYNNNVLSYIISANRGDKIIEPSMIPKDDMYIEGWYTEANGQGTKWNFEDNKVSGPLSLYANWKSNAPENFVCIPANPDFVFDSGLAHTGVSDANAVAAVNTKYGTSYVSGTDIYEVKDKNSEHWALYCNTKRVGGAAPILKKYYMDAYYITNRQWKAFCDATDHPYPSYWTSDKYGTSSGFSTDGTEIFLPKFEDKLDHPVMSIGYTDVIAYCQWYEKQHPGWFFRLPTGAEWENAARGDRIGMTYPWGNDPPTYTYNPETRKGSGTIYELAAYSGYMAANLIDMYGYDYVVDLSGKSYELGELLQINNGAVNNWSAGSIHFTSSSLYRLWSNGVGGLTTPVGAFEANCYGLYDMVGNCWTLTSTHMAGVFGPELGKDCVSVRGGSYYAQMASLRISFRRETRDVAAAGFNTVGARLAAEEIGKEIIVNYNLISGDTTIVYHRALTIGSKAVKDGFVPEYIFSSTGPGANSPAPGPGGNNAAPGPRGNSETPVKLLVFDGWYYDEACTKLFDFDSNVTDALNLFGKWMDSGKTASYTSNTGKLVIND